MLRTAESLRSDSLRRYGHAFDYRIGIHTGRVISGIVGRDKYAYDIWGDAVNVASRMEQHSEVGRINISEDTNAIVRTMIPTEYRGKILVKNKGEVGMYFVS
jgi:adenylate cyclase